tara:strand:+ start:128 stop:313 length:186 start_codon:yes stop_codon:yes gene_type:complete
MYTPRGKGKGKERGELSPVVINLVGEAVNLFTGEAIDVSKTEATKINPTRKERLDVSYSTI